MPSRLPIFTSILLILSSASAAQVELVADDWHARVPELDMTVLLTPVGPSKPRVLSVDSPPAAPPGIQVLRYHAGGAGTSVIVEVEKCLVIDTAASTLLGEADCAYRASDDRPMEQPKWTWQDGTVVIEAADGTDRIELDRTHLGSEDFGWRFFEESFTSGTLRVSYATSEVGSYEIGCSLETGDTAGDEQEDEDTERSTVRALEVSAYPNPVIVAECAIGAHSRQILVFDPLRDSKEAVLRRTGAFVARTDLWTDRLRLEYDRRCSDCEAGFELLAEIWPARDDSELPPRSMQPSELVQLLYDDQLGGLPVGYDPEFASRLLSRELGRIFQQVEANPYPGELDFDPIVDGQDALLTDLRVRPAKIEGNKATVEVSFKNFDTPVTLTYHLLLEDEGWRLDNIVSPHWDMRALLTAGQ